jgi:hypothetical protein
MMVFCNFAVKNQRLLNIKSVKMTKKSIFRDQFSWKVRNFATQLTIATFCCSISQPNWYLERDFYEQNQYYIEAVPYGADFNHSSIGAVPSPAESMDGACAFFMPIPIVLPPTRL